jgi:hypothetical protein
MKGRLNEDTTLLSQAQPEPQQFADKLFWYARTSVFRSVTQQENAPPGCSKRPSSKAAASEVPRRTLRGTLRL